jgi:hypothetical protein
MTGATIFLVVLAVALAWSFACWYTDQRARELRAEYDRGHRDGYALGWQDADDAYDENPDAWDTHL